MPLSWFDEIDPALDPLPAEPRAATVSRRPNDDRDWSVWYAGSYGIAHRVLRGPSAENAILRVRATLDPGAEIFGATLVG